MARATGFGLLTTDRELIVRSWNGWLASATGVAEAEAQGRPLVELIAADRRDMYREIFADVLEKGAPRVLAPAFHQYLFACPPAAPSPHFEHMQQRVTVAPLLTEGSVAGVLVTVEDMTTALDEARALAARIQEGGEGTAASAALEAIGATDWRVRGAAVKTLRKSASPEDVAYLLETLARDHQNLDVLSGALNVLISTDRDVVPALVSLLSDPHANVRMHAALALGELRDESAVAALVGALDDDDANVRFHAIEALGRIAAPAAVDSLTRIAESGDFFLSFPAIDALARTDDPRVAPNLLALLQQDLLRPAVIDALAALGDEDSVPALIDMLNTGRGEAGPIAAALEQMRDRYERTFAAGEQIVEMARAAITADGLRHLQQAIARRDEPLASIVTVTGWLGAGAIDALAGLVGDPLVGDQAAEGLVAIGRAAVLPLIDSLGTADRTRRRAAAVLLGRLADRRAVPALTELLNTADADLVATATAALATIGDSRVLDDLLPLFGHEHPAVRQAAIAAVNTIGATAAESRMRERLTDRDARVRECAVRVAGYFGFDVCVPGIIAALGDADEDVRRAAIEQLAVVDEPTAALRLATAIRSETPRNRAAAAHAARALDDPALDAALVAALGDPDPWVRYFAAGSLGERGHTDSVRALTAIAADDAAPQVRIAALQAIGELDADAAVALADRYLREGDDDIACAALTATATARTAKADDLLERAIHSASVPVRQCAIDALSSRNTARAVDTLAVAARMTEPASLAAAAVEALARIAGAAHDTTSPAAVAALVDVATQPGRRAGVVDAVARLDARALDLVAAALADPRPAARLTAVEALARMRHPRASAALTTALGDEDAAVRAAAVSGFGRLGTPAIAGAIAALCDDDPDPAVRRKAAIVCQRYGWRT
jgi:HEAT repeat protein